MVWQKIKKQKSITQTITSFWVSGNDKECLPSHYHLLASKYLWSSAPVFSFNIPENTNKLVINDHLVALSLSSFCLLILYDSIHSLFCWANWPFLHYLVNSNKAKCYVSKGRLQWKSVHTSGQIFFAICSPTEYLGLSNGILTYWQEQFCLICRHLKIQYRKKRLDIFFLYLRAPF